MPEAAGAAPPSQPQWGDTLPSHIGALPTFDELPVVAGAPPHSAWGLWGFGDRVGTLNLITDEAVRRAAATVRTGRVIPLNASLTAFDPPLFGRSPLQHTVESFSRGRVRDETVSGLNTQASSQWDGLRHVSSRFYGFYNGAEERTLGITNWAERGIAGRGVLLDIERWFPERGRALAYDGPSPIEVDDLHALVADHGITLATGDLLVLHTGWLDHWRAARRRYEAGPFATPGLRPSRAMLAALWDMHCAAVVTDVPALEVWPPGACASEEVRAQARTDPEAEMQVFMHSHLIAMLGMAVGELWDTGPLARACRSEARTDFLLVSAPLNLPGGVASTSNAVALL